MLDSGNGLAFRAARANGLQVSLLGLGCMGMSEFYGDSDEQQSRDVIHYAVERGVRFFDTADVYGYGHNERLLGGALGGLPNRDEIVLATKGGIVRDSADSASRAVNTSADYISAAIDRSLERLQTRIDLYYLHRVEEDGARIEESMYALAAALQAGKIGAVGLSEVSERTIRRAETALRRATEGVHGISAVQTEYSLMTRHIEIDGVDQTCRELGILLVAYSPICRGLLADPGFNPGQLSCADFRRKLPRFTGDNLVHNQRLVQGLAEIARMEGLTAAQVALAWVLSRGPHIVPIPGTRNPDRLDENIAACRVALGAESLQRLDEMFALNSAAGTRYTAAAMHAYGLAL